MHTTKSDGKASPEDVVAAYSEAGFDFVVITDHDHLTTVQPVPGLLIIPGVEETSAEGHLVTVNPGKEVPSKSAQVIIDDAVDNGGLAILAHPTLSGLDFAHDELMELDNYSAIEIHNELVQATMGASGAEELWDSLLSKDRLVFGVASDDMHALSPDTSFAKAWIKVFANSLSVDDVTSSIRTGNFISTTGPELTIEVSGSEVRARTDEPSTIEFIGEGGVVLRSERNSSLGSYAIAGHEKYVRVRVTHDSNGKRAWSNPVLVAAVSQPHL